MDTFWYRGPSFHEFVLDPGPDWMRWVMRRGEEYWSQQATTGAWLYCFTEPLPEVPTVDSRLSTLARSTLFFQYHPRHGWYFEYTRKGEAENREQILFTFDPAAPRRRIKQLGNEWSATYRLVGCYVRQGFAEQVVADFLSTGQPSPAVSWAEWGSLDVPVYLEESEYREQRRKPKDSTGPDTTPDP